MIESLKDIFIEVLDFLKEFIPIVISACFFLLMFGFIIYELGKLYPDKEYNIICIHNIEYIGSNRGGYIPSIDSTGKPITCEVEK